MMESQTLLSDSMQSYKTEQPHKLKPPDKTKWLSNWMT